MKKTSSLDAHIETTLRSELGNNYDHNRIKAVMKLMDEFHDDMQPLQKATIAGEVDGRTYANAFNRRYGAALREIAKVLGPADYERVFGEPPGLYTGIVDPDIAARAYPKR